MVTDLVSPGTKENSVGNTLYTPGAVVVILSTARFISKFGSEAGKLKTITFFFAEESTSTWPKLITKLGDKRILGPKPAPDKAISLIDWFRSLVSIVREPLNSFRSGGEK